MAANIHKTPRPREVLHDQAPSVITDHPFIPKGEWWSLCGHENCNLAESAHAETTLNPIRYLGDDEDE
jgi:hypothetical protein